MFISCQLTINNIINQIPFSLSSIMVEKDIFKLSDCLKVDAKKTNVDNSTKVAEDRGDQVSSSNDQLKSNFFSIIASLCR